MLGAGFGGCVEFRWEYPLVGPGEDRGVRGRCSCIVVLAGDVEVEVEKGLGVGLDEGGESEQS